MWDANQKDSDSKNIEKEQQPANTYKTIEPPPEVLEGRIEAADSFIHPDVKAAEEVQKPASDPPAPQPPSHELWTVRLRRFMENPTKFYAAIGVGLGLLIIVVFFAVTLLRGNPEGRNDMGPVISDGTGLKGYLYIKWEKTLQYRLTIETIYPEQRAGFALAVGNPPYPLSIEIHLEDNEGVTLCSREIVLKYDARSASTAANPPNETPAAINYAQRDAVEQEREQGKDIFQYQLAPDGKVAALNAQGGIPCSATAYEKTTQWSFSTNFPSIAEQDEVLTRQREGRASATQNSAAHNKMAAKPAEKLVPFSSEGDDAIVEFNVNSGVIVTSGRKTFFIDKTSAQRASPVWQEYPVNIHFRCSRSSDCTIMHSGAGALRAKLRR